MAKVTRDLLEYESIVMDELLAHGYPKESIVLEGQVDTRRFVDFIINDIDTGLPMMMIEMKSCGERTQTAVRQLAFDSLKRYYNKNASPIKAVAAILDREKKKLEFIDYTEAVKEDNFDRAVNDYSLPPYKILTIGARQKAINQQKEKQKRNITVLKVLCWGILPLVCLALVLLDAFGIYTFSTLRLVAIGAGAVITLIPCFKEIKIGEIPLKNQIEKQKEETKHDV